MMDRREWNRVHGAIEEGPWTPTADFELVLLNEIWKLWEERDALEREIHELEDELDHSRGTIDHLDEEVFALEEELSELKNAP
jgi:wobble nucleotide-excising tRNase